MHAHTHEVMPCTTDPNTKWEPCAAAEAAVMRMLGYPVREIGEDKPAAQIAWSDDGELFNDDSLGDLIDRLGGGANLVGRAVWFGECEQISPGQLIDCGDVLDHIGDRACDLVGETADDYVSFISTEAKAELDSLLSAWIEKHAPPTFWSVSNSTKYTITASDLRRQP